MNIQFTDIYGQHITVHNETASGNIRIMVNTMPSMNDLRGRGKCDCTVETDISLDENRLDLLIAALKTARGVME